MTGYQTPRCQSCGCEDPAPDWTDVEPRQLADGSYRWACCECAQYMHPVSAMAWPLPDDSLMPEHVRDYYDALSGVRPG